VIAAGWTLTVLDIGVVRAGSTHVAIWDWFNGHNIVKVIPPGSGNEYTGLGSTVHAYPSASVQRQYTITSDPNAGDQPGNDYVQVPTQDGINVSLEGTFFFTTGFDGSQAGERLVRDFDSRFGVRTFNVDATSANQLYPWQGNTGWEAWLNTVVRPIINNDLRVEIGKYTCAQLVSSCSLVYNQSISAVKSAGTTSNSTLAQIQSAINASLETDIQSTLGEDYFCARTPTGQCSQQSGIQFRLAKVTLPGTIQNEINRAQAQYAAVGEAKAQLQQAHYQAAANAEKENGYRSCPACAAIDELKAIPSNVTTFAPGAGFAITTK
jgi:hypothetical protein